MYLRTYICETYLRRYTSENRMKYSIFGRYRIYQNQAREAYDTISDYDARYSENRYAHRDSFRANSWKEICMKSCVVSGDPRNSHGISKYSRTNTWTQIGNMI